MNECKITGTLVKVPSVMTTKNGNKVCHFLVKVLRGTQAYDNIQCVAWRDNAEYLAGRAENEPLTVIGHLEVSSYKGNYKMEVVADHVQANTDEPTDFPF